MITSTCHCGLVRISIPHAPQAVTNCNCSICRRYGALWAYYPVDTVQVQGHPEHTREYIWGDKTLRTLHCSGCGCVTHWEPLRPEAGVKLGVNVRMFEPEQLGDFRIRLFDGAKTWRFCDE